MPAGAHEHGALAPESAALVARGEAALAAGDADGALQIFEQAANREHAADIELGIVRAHMQAGQYRRALAFAAHTAAAHRDHPDGAAMYAWLLNVGAQQGLAQTLIARMPPGAGDDPFAAAALAQLKQPMPVATGELLAPPARLAPYADREIPAGARIAGNGVLVDGGRAVLVAQETLAGTGRIFVRNGLGQGSAAEPEGGEAIAGLVRLRLLQPLPMPPVQLASRDAFPGSSGYVAEYATAMESAPAWPLMYQGFVGMPLADGKRRLGIEVPAGRRGGPVFDAAGRFSGIALAGDAYVPASLLRSRLGEFVETPAAVSARQVEEVYETAMRMALQIIALP